MPLELNCALLIRMRSLGLFTQSLWSTCSSSSLSWLRYTDYHVPHCPTFLAGNLSVSCHQNTHSPTHGEHLGQHGKEDLTLAVGESDWSELCWICYTVTFSNKCNRGALPRSRDDTSLPNCFEDAERDIVEAFASIPDTVKR